MAFVSLNYRRLAKLRPDYGYTVEVENFHPDMDYAEDGLFRYDIDSGNTELIVSLDRLINNSPCSTMTGAQHKVNHVMYAPLGRKNRLMFMHRWINKGKKKDRLYTVNDDGSELYLLIDDGMVSHCSWLGIDRIISFCRQKSGGDRYYLFEDRSTQVLPVADALLKYGNGHPTYESSGRWLITDCYPHLDRRTRLLLWDSVNDRFFEIGQFYLSPLNYGIKRCDHHPRWSPAGNSVSFDSCESGTRTMSVLDVRSLLA
jgi:hypothetical protein